MANVTVFTDFTSWSCSDFVLPTLHPRSGRPIVFNAGRDPVENTPFTSMTFAMRCPDDRVFLQKRMHIVGAPQVIFSVGRCATSLMIDSSAPDKVQRLLQNTGEYDSGYFQLHRVSLLTNANNSGANNLRLPESLLHLLFRVSFLVKRMVAQDPCTHVWING